MVSPQTKVLGSWYLRPQTSRQNSTRPSSGALPNCKDRVGILNVVLKDKKVEDGIDLARIAGLCEGYSGSDLTELCKTAVYLPIQDFLDSEKNGKQPQVRGPEYHFITMVAFIYVYEIRSQDKCSRKRVRQRLGPRKTRKMLRSDSQSASYRSLLS